MSDPITHVDIELMRLRMGLSPGQRIQASIDAHEFLVGIIRSRLRAAHPDLSDYAIGLMIVEEIERAKRLEARSNSLSQRPPAA